MLFPLVLLVLLVYNGVYGEPVYKVSDVDILGQGVPVTTAAFLPVALLDIFRFLARRPIRLVGLRPLQVRTEVTLWLTLFGAQLLSSAIYGITSVGLAYIAGGVFFLAWFYSVAQTGGFILVSRPSSLLWSAYLVAICIFGFGTGGGLRIMPDNNINLVAMIVLAGMAQVYVAVVSSKISPLHMVSVFAGLAILVGDFRRTALISLALATILLLFGRSNPGKNAPLAIRLRQVRRLGWTLGLVGVAAVAVVPSLRAIAIDAWEYAYDGIYVFDDGARLDGDARRAQVMTQGWDVAKLHFPFGVGHGHYLEVLARSIPGADIIRPHNFVLISIAELGAVGLVLSVVVLFAPVALLLRRNLGVIPCVVALLPIPFMLTNDYVFSPGYWIPTAMAFQLLWTLNPLLERRRTSSHRP